MRRAARLSLIVVLLALPAVVAAGNANNLAPCRTYTDVTACGSFCDPSELYNTCACFWDDPTVPDGFPLDHQAGPNCTEAHPCCWNRPCSTFETANDCAVGGGGSPPDTEANCHWFPSTELGGGRCGCAPPLVDIPLPANQSEERFAPFDCDCPYLTHAEWSAQGGQGPCGPPPLDHFTFYKAKTSKGADKFVRFGSILLSDAFQTNASYHVTKPVKLGLPSNKNAEGVSDADTHREEYLVKPVKGGPAFVPRADVHVVNQCNDLLVDVAKPVSLLVPTAKSLTDPVVAPDLLHHNLEHFLCY